MVVLAALASCGETVTTPVDPGTQSGDPDRQSVMYGVITSKDAPLEGVRVSGGAETVSSDAAGKYRTYLPPGDRTIVFAKEGYNQVNKPVSAGSKSKIKADIAMTPKSGGAGGDEYVFREGHYVEFKVNPASGWIEFDVTLDEGGRSSDWDKKAIISLYDGTYHAATTGLVDLLPYKLKWCYARSCKEPRYNLAWSRWRHVRMEWNTTEVRVKIDGERLGGSLVGPFNPGSTKLMYGDHPKGYGPLPGGRMKNIVRSN
jgi:hypothetical protein